MRVKRLDLLGFKSFATKISIQFEPGVTAIVGPNGSGKSNLVDSIRWVLGEHNPRDVRAPRLEDVIFNGTDTTAPLSLAEVSLTVENEQGALPIAFTEVQLTRRVYRSGESECFINQSPCRLKDIQELFLGTGLGGGTYAIIEQGHIDLILSSKPEERRVVFEEASGIARYLTKKQETLRKLDQVEQDLLRLADIAQEVRRQLSALERQAAKARQYKAQWEQLKNLELRLAADELRQGEQAHQEAAKALTSLTQQRSALEQQRQQLLASVETCNAAVAATQGALQDLRTRLVESTSQIEQHASQQTLKRQWVDELTGQRAQLTHDEAQLEERTSQLGQQLERLTAQAAALDQQHQEVQAQRTTISAELLTLEQELAESLQALEQRKGALFEAAANASQRRNALADVTLRVQQLEMQAARVQDQRRALHQRVETLAQRQHQLEQERKTAGERQQALQRQLTAARESAAQAQRERDELMGRLHGVRERLLGQRAKVQLLEEVWRRHEGFPDSVKTLLANPPGGVLGLLVDLLDPQPGYEQAVESALGPLASAIVVKDRQTLRHCQQLLAANQLGGAQFVVLSDCPSQPRESPAPPAQQGVLGRLAQFIRHDPAYGRLAEWLLGEWQLVDEFTRLLQAAPAPRGAWVSKTGDRWDGRSWQLGGSGVPNRVGRKRQSEQAREELEALEREAASMQQTVQQTEERWQSLVAHEEQVKRQGEQLTADFTKLDAQWSSAQHEVKRIQDELNAHELEGEDLAAQQGELADAHAKAAEAVAEAEARQQQLETTLKQLQAQREETAQRRQQHLVSLAQLDAAVNAVVPRQEELRTRVEELQADQRRVSAQREDKRTQARELAAKAAELSQQLEAHRTQIAQVTEGQSQVQAEVERVTQALRGDEARRDQVMPSLLAVEQELLTLTQTLKDQESQLAERGFRRTRVLERLREVYRVEEAHVLAEQSSLTPPNGEERRQLSEQVERLKGKLETMGPVNLGSVEEYDELSKRREFLQTQQDDLLKAQEDLRHSIQQINRTARSQFRETFVKIQQEFQHYFTRLFGGGQAELLLLDEDDVLESGIEIRARPPGKRPQSISLLSGGERALTAIALLFALFKVRPSPFCILDEIDAPLDEANIDRFTKVLEEFLSLSQFILITHNKKTITKADCLYGVTMEQAGISKLVSVKFTKSKRPHPAPSVAPATSPEQTVPA